MEKVISMWLSVLLPIFILSMPGKSLADQKPEKSAFQEKMPVIINKGYVLLEKNEAGKLLAQSNHKEKILGVGNTNLITGPLIGTIKFTLKQQSKVCRLDRGCINL
jgi:hypothetical protein